MTYIKGNNLMPYPYYDTTVTRNGITFTDNRDGSITVNGTATRQAYFYLTEPNSTLLTLKTGELISFGKGDNDTIRMGIAVMPSGLTANQYKATNTTLTYSAVNETQITQVYLVVDPDIVCDNVVVWPMLNMGTTVKPFDNGIIKLKFRQVGYSLPEEYQAVEYIYTLPNAYIDLDFIPTKNTEIKMKYAKNGNYAGTNSFLFCARQDLGVNPQFSLGVLFAPGFSGYRFDWGSNQFYFDTDATVAHQVYDLWVKKNEIYIDNKLLFSAPEWISGDGIASGSIRLFTTKSTPQSYSHWKIYAVKITENGVVQYNMIPCVRKSDSTAGLYDLISNRFFSSNGTDAFSAGAEINVSPKKVNVAAPARNPKNLLPLPYYQGNNYTTNGITFTVDEDGVMTANGTSTAAAYFRLLNYYSDVLKPNTTYTLSGNMDPTHCMIYVLIAKDGSWVKEFYNRDKSCTFTVEEGYDYTIQAHVSPNSTIENVKFRPVLNEGSTAEPYFVPKSTIK